MTVETKTKATDGPRRGRRRAAKSGRPRAPLSRERVAREALGLVDERGLEGLTMRALGERLGVEAMSLYNHVAGRAGLEAEIVALLWGEAERSLEDGADWRDSLRSLARCLRALATDHPRAFPLLLGASAFAGPMLRVLGPGLDVLLDAGFGQDRAAQTVNAVVSYAAGYGAMEISCFAAVRAREAGADQFALELARLLPPDAPPELVRVARCTCGVDPSDQFEFGLEALLAGLEPACNTHRPAA
ncbi:MAG: TetR/AcrR family transcriptional regulator C-terminal domain-containing protein [Actinobacteria bacterium]|nr:TetR/AcrR family transcriptional regulator C-terminal domain-containing protein [Actinomycetota bacterium]